MHTSTSAWRRWWSAIAAVTLLGLLAAACGSGGDDEEAGGSDGTAAAGGTQESQTLGCEGTPVEGGEVVYALESEPDGMNPIVNRWAISGHVYAMAVYDYLAAYDADLTPQPYLAESFTPNETYTSWDIKLRPDVTFHNGTPLTAVAVKQNLEGHLDSALTGGAVRGYIDSVEVKDELTATVTMSEPWATFPTVLTGQIGVVAEPSVLTSDGRAPIGTGPFKFVSWTTGDSFVVEKNTDYWRTDEAGNALPYLDKVTYNPVVEAATRKNGLGAGQYNLIHTTNPTDIKELRDLAAAGEIQLAEDQGEVEEGFVMLNTAKPPFDDPDLRRALALATDRERYVDVISDGVRLPANGPFSESNPWYSDPGYPDYDLEGAQALIEQWSADNGGAAPGFTLSTGQDVTDESAVLQQMWTEAGFEVQVTAMEQQSLINNALLGQFEANLWRQYGEPDPDQDYVWWISTNAGELDTLALNFSRFASEEVDEALREGRSTTDVETRKAAYARLQQVFGREIPYVWLDRVSWAIGADNSVRCIENGPLPDGQPALPLGGHGPSSGVQLMTQVWRDTGQ